MKLLTTEEFQLGGAHESFQRKKPKKTLFKKNKTKKKRAEVPKILLDMATSHFAPPPPPPSVPAPVVPWEQACVPVVVRGRMEAAAATATAAVRLELPVSGGGGGRGGGGGECLSVHLQVHQFVARARRVRRVAAAAVGTQQAQHQREEAHTWGRGERGGGVAVRLLFFNLI